MRRLNYLWRLMGTGLVFAFIFFGGALLAATAGPVCRAMGGDSQRRIRHLIHRAFAFCMCMLQALRLIRLEMEGVEKLRTAGGRMIIANHPSILDVVILVALMPRSQCIVKHQLWNHPLLGGLMRSAGYIRNDLEPAALVERCRESIADGEFLIIFPEGTRTTPGSAPKIQRGFANIATLVSAPVQPVYIRCDPPTLVKGEAWWHIPARKPRFQVVVDEFLDVNHYLMYKAESRSISARRLVSFVENYYAGKMQHA